MENKEIVIKGKGIKVSILSTIFIVIGVICMIASIGAIKRIYIKNNEMMDSYQLAELEREAATGFKTASDYLTNQARQFVVNGDIKNAENYFEEKNISKRREAAIALIGNYQTLDLERNLLSGAMELSEELVKYELHAMKLIANVDGIDEALLPGELVSFELPQEEMLLDEAEKQKLAIQLLYGKEYEEYKDKINWDVESAITLIKDESGARYREEESDLIFVLNIATLLIFILFMLLMLIFVFDTFLVIRPAKKFTLSLDKKEKLPVIGGYEFRKFARKYNDIYRSNEKNLELLREQDEVDELTGTLKSSTLELVRHNLSQHNEPLGIMLIGIDNFKSIGEANGYDMADRVVAKVANLLLTSFKGSDYIIRTSRDEFEIFLLRMKKEDSELLQGKIAKINKKLQDTGDGVVAASISVGISFSENGYTIEAENGVRPHDSGV